MYKFILLVAIFVAGCHAICPTSKLFDCLGKKLNELEDLSANKTTLCSDLDKVQKCEEANGCGMQASVHLCSK
ncbi:hypothetical protein Ahia01_000453300 [Argonauta hians]